MRARQDQRITESAEAMAGSTIVISHREFEIKGCTVKSHLPNSGTDTAFRQHRAVICPTPIRRPYAKINTVGGNICLRACQKC